MCGSLIEMKTFGYLKSDWSEIDKVGIAYIIIIRPLVLLLLLLSLSLSLLSLSLLLFITYYYYYSGSI